MEENDLSSYKISKILKTGEKKKRDTWEIPFSLLPIEAISKSLP